MPHFLTRDGCPDWMKIRVRPLGLRAGHSDADRMRYPGGWGLFWERDSEGAILGAEEVEFSWDPRAGSKVAQFVTRTQLCDCSVSTPLKGFHDRVTRRGLFLRRGATLFWVCSLNAKRRLVCRRCPIKGTRLGQPWSQDEARGGNRKYLRGMGWFK